MHYASRLAANLSNLAHEILSHQDMLIYKKRQLNLFNYLVSEFHTLRICNFLYLTFNINSGYDKYELVLFSWLQMGHIARNPVFGACDGVRIKPEYSAERQARIIIGHSSLHIVNNKGADQAVLYLVITCNKIRFSHDEPEMFLFVVEFLKTIAGMVVSFYIFRLTKRQPNTYVKAS